MARRRPRAEPAAHVGAVRHGKVYGTAPWLRRGASARRARVRARAPAEDAQTCERAGLGVPVRPPEINSSADVSELRSGSPHHCLPRVLSSAGQKQTRPTELCEGQTPKRAKGSPTQSAQPLLRRHRINYRWSFYAQSLVFRRICDPLNCGSAAEPQETLRMSTTFLRVSVQVAAQTRLFQGER